jgi:hypothetical protein
MSHSSPVRSRTAAADGPIASLYRGLSTEVAMILSWAFSPIRRLLETLLGEGAGPPTIFPRLPPGQLPPIDALRDELRSHSGNDPTSSAVFGKARWPDAGIPGRSREREPS